MRTGVIIGSAIAGAVTGALLTMDASDRRKATNFLSDLWGKVPRNVKNILPNQLNVESVGGKFKTPLRTASKKAQSRFANAGRVGDRPIAKRRGR